MPRNASLSALVPLLLSSVAWADDELPSLEHHLAAASTGSFEAQAALATEAQRSAEASQSLWQLFPRLSLRAAYTRNEPEVEIEIPTGPGESKTAIITPRNQLDGTVQLDVPLIDVGAWLRVAQTSDLDEAARHRTRATVATVQKSTARAYFALVGAHALRQSAQRSLAAAEESQEFVRRRLAAGFATELDVLRAVAEVERSRQVLVGADAQIKSAARQLATLTGEDVVGVPVVVEDDLHAEVVIATDTLGDLPAIQAARAEKDAQDKLVLSSFAALAPTVSATAVDRLTNAAGFGENNALAVGVALSWRLDGGSFQAARTQQALSAAAAIREAQTLQSARDELDESKDRFDGEIARARAARAQQDATSKAAAIARQRLAAGTATLIDGVLADRDAFAADVARIEADVNVKLARVLLRLAAGAAVTTTSATATSTSTPATATSTSTPATATSTSTSTPATAAATVATASAGGAR